MAKVRPIRVYPENQDEVFLATYMQSKKKKNYPASSKKTVSKAEEIVEEAKKK